MNEFERSVSAETRETGGIWYDNTLRNWESGVFEFAKHNRVHDPELKTEFGSCPLKGQYRDFAELLNHGEKPRPTLVLCAGPSLEKDIALARDVSDRMIVICVDNALRFVLESGITPHLVLTLDPKPDVAKFFAGLDTAGLSLVAPVCIAPEALAEWRGNVYFYAHTPSNLLLWEGLPVIESMSDDLRAATGVQGYLLSFANVGQTAMSLAAALNSKIIIMLGLDLSWTAERYCAGAWDWLPAPTDAKEVKGLFEQVRFTNKQFLIHRQSCILYMDYLAGIGINIFNCSAGGILNHQWLPFAEALRLMGVKYERA